MEPRNRQRATAGVTLGVAALLVVAACGGGSGSSKASGATTSAPPSTSFRTIPITQPPTTAPPAPAPAAGGGGGGGAASGGNTYTVKAGDAWPYIARKLGVSLDALLAANGATAKQPLYPGDKLVVPGKDAPSTTAAGADTGSAGSADTTAAASGGGSTYTVKAGDYWIGIAKKLGVNLNALLSANGATYTTPLTPGSKINVPAKG